MRRRLRFTPMILSFLLAGASAAGAQQTAGPAAPARVAAAAELVDAMKADSAVLEGIQQNLPTPPGADSATFARMRIALSEFTRKYIDLAKVHADYVSAYAEAFTEDELRQLSAFYKTPLGVKWRLQSPAATRRAMASWAADMQKHLPELQQMMMDAMDH